MLRPYDLSSMTALLAFEAAARHGSFKLAARELNVTAAAISHQIKALEADLGRDLFRRQHRGVELTDQGKSLLLALQRGLETISDGVTQARSRPDTADVTISTTTAVSALWLTPRITAFWRTQPDITVSQIVSDVPAGVGRTDLSIFYADRRSDTADDRQLFPDRILALGAPGFALENHIGKLEDLLAAPLIHSGEEAAGWTTWSDWFAGLGLPAPRGRRFNVNNYMIALQAAQDGVGAVLGWERLVHGLLADRKLVPLFTDAIPAPQPFHLRVHSHASPKARLLADWLVQQA
ncbi:LysR family transcriptional regulator [Novosphingobium sp. CCH12-A3]|uniref:LysR family transcriptional regulator n=1 Tax=Novosphingobium sp. CCH12-A3 TaxID=1768752 RepID=UPI0007806C2C|nr:LysR family transcriptional regulator [Novosphingobium sp. CCH12-A3]